MSRPGIGARGRDRVTGFEGTIVSRTEYLTGVARVTLEALVEGKVVEAYFDEERIESAASRPDSPMSTYDVVRDPREHGR